LLEQDGEKKEEEEEKQRAACKNKTFEEFLRKQNLTENLVHFVVYAIAMVRPDTPAEEGLLQTRCVSQQFHMQCWGSVTFWCGSGSRGADPYI
jgi:hypothetical protein